MTTLLVIEYAEGCGYNCGTYVAGSEPCWASRRPFNRAEMEGRIAHFLKHCPSGKIVQHMVYSLSFTVPPWNVAKDEEQVPQNDALGEGQKGVKSGECFVCAEDFCWDESDGDLYVKEVCSPECLDSLETFGSLWAQESRELYRSVGKGVNQVADDKRVVVVGKKEPESDDYEMVVADDFD